MAKVGRPRKDSPPPDLIGWALAGLEQEIAATAARLSALQAHAAELGKHAGRGSRDALPATSAPSTERGWGGARFKGKGKKYDKLGRKKGTPRRPLTPDEKAAISKRMKKRWREWRETREGKQE